MRGWLFGVGRRIMCCWWWCITSLVMAGRWGCWAGIFRRRMRRGCRAGRRGGIRCRCSTPIMRCGSGSCWGMRVIRGAWGRCRRGSGWRRWRGCRRIWRCRLTIRGRRWLVSGAGRGVLGAGGADAGWRELARRVWGDVVHGGAGGGGGGAVAAGGGHRYAAGGAGGGARGEGLAELVGFFVNTLVLRTDAGG